MVVLVTYDLKTPGKNYDDLYYCLKNNISTDFIHPLESVWLFNTEKSASAVSSVVKAEMDDNDSLLVTQVTKNHAGWLPKSDWDWISARV